MFSLPGFAIKAQIYESANSLVYRGINQQDQTSVILKVLKEDYLNKAELTRYKQEYEIIRSLNVEGVIKAYSLQEYQQTLVIILEDFGGESLQKLMKESEIFQFPMPLAEFLRFAIKITKILGGIHSSNVIHKDINPSNIVLNPKTGVIKIIDFGISTRLTSTNPTLSHPNVIEGTLAYMSPEQTGRMNRSLDYRTDFYSLGVTFYELLTGQLPFTTTNALELVHCHIAKQSIPPHLLEGRETPSIVPQCPKAVSDIVMKLMAKTADERYQSAWGIVADLEECLLQLESMGRIQEFPLGTYDSSDKFQIPQKLYGREVEVATLLEAFDRVATDGRNLTDDLLVEGEFFLQAEQLFVAKTEMMLVAGYSGIGKSVLVAEVYKPITRQKGYFISGKFDQLGRNVPYSAIVRAFTELVRQLLTESEVHLNQWREKILSALGVNGQVILDVIPEVELIIGKQPPIPELGLTESQNRFNLVFQNFIRVFGDRKHPLVIFLDDLQWADMASLKLLQLMLTDANIQYLFLIGAYRDNEVSSIHPLMITLEELRQEGAIINQITLAPLKLPHVSELIADTLHSDIATVKPLAELVLQKTQGNPFFVKEFLKTLYAENLITFSLEEVRTQSSIPRQNPSWKWELSKIEAIGITDNVVELMIASLNKLPNSTQEILRLAACIGASFNLNTLSIISGKSLQEVFRDLGTAIQAGLILPISELDEQLLIQNHKFRHDRIQQAAYTLISDEDKKALHLQISRLLLQNTLPDRLSEQIFEIVEHLNLGIECVSSSDERNEIARLNWIAGTKAKASTAYDLAIRYLNQGREILREDSWDTHYELTLSLYEASVEVEYLNADYEQVELLSNILFQRANTVLDKVKTYGIKILCYSAQNQMQAAIDTGLEVLELLGVSLSQSQPQNLIVEELYNLPSMRDSYKQRALWIFMILFAPIYTTQPERLPLLSFTMVELCINYGNSAYAAYAYGLYGLLLCSVLGDIELGYQLGKLALRLLDKFEAQEIKCRVLNNFYSFIINWKDAVRNSLEPLRETIQVGLETGEVEFACYAAVNYCHNLALLGKPLDYSLSEIQNYTSLIGSLKQKFQLYYAQIWGQFVLILNDNLGSRDKLIGKIYNEEENLPILVKANNASSLYCLYLVKTIINYLFKDYAKAIGNASLAEKYEPNLVGLFPFSQNAFYYSLALLAQYSQVSPNQQLEYLEKVGANQQKMKIWADHAPMNYLHKYELVEAEKARVLGQYWEATELYERAIQGARENQYLHEEALAYELAGEFYLAQGRTKMAQTYLTEAYYGYVRWQARSKVRDLEERYPQFFSQTLSSLPKTSTTSSSSTEISSTLDLTSILKASQALSGELSLENLLAKMMKIVIENAGAQKGFLILRSLAKPGNANEEWRIEASGTIASDEVQVLQSIPMEAVSSSETPMVSNAIANYVIRTQKSVVLHDAVHEGEFTRDSYILQQQPKSILCTPLIHQGKLVGILYLENNLTTGAFTPERLEVLNLLSSQIAISIENAKLYAQLRESESKWTQLLEAVPVGISVHDFKGKVCYINQTGQRLLGQGVCTEAEPEQLAQTYQVYLAQTNQLYPTEQLPALRALKGEQVLVEDFELHRDGRMILCEVRATPVFNENGNIIYAISTFQDITDRKQAEKLLTDYNRTLEAEVTQRTIQLTAANQQLEQEISDRKLAELALGDSEQRYRQIVETAEEGIWVINAEGNTTFANPKMAQMLGYTVPQMLGMPVFAFMDEQQQAIVKQNLKRRRQGISEKHDFKLRRKDGSELWVMIASSPIFDESGQYTGALGMITDISDRKAAETALRQQKELLQTIFDHIPVMLCFYDANVEVQLANRAFETTLGWSLEELRHIDIMAECYPDPDYRASVLEFMMRADGTWQDIHLITRAGILLETCWANVRFPDGSQVGIGQDITARKRAELALQESENRFRAVFEQAAVGIGLCTLEGRFFRVNQKLCDIVGYTHAEMLERTFQDITTVKDRPQLQALVRHLFTGAIENHSLENRYICKDGSLVWVNVTFSLMHEPTGEPKSFIYVAEDISDRKRAELALLKSEHALAEAQRLAHLGNWSFDLLTREITWSEETFRIYGLDPTQGEPTEEEHLQQLHPNDREQMMRSVELASTQGRPYEHEIRIFLPDGSMRYTLGRGQPVFNEMGQVVQLFGTVQDITERKQAEEELRESEEKFRQLAENIQEVFFMLSQTGEVLYISPTYEHIWGRSCQSLYQNPRSWLESVHPEEQQAMAVALNHQIGNSAEFDETYRIVRPDGEIRWIRARSFPIKHHNSYRFVGIAEDISERKLTEEVLQQAKLAAEAANRAKSAFLANMSHELRTPLNAILGFSQLIARSSSLPPEHQKNLDTIIHSGEHLLTLINQVLDLSKIEAGRTILHEMNFNLYHFLDDVKDMFQLKANNKGLYLQFERSLDTPQYIRTDEVKLRQVLINLLSNAMKFTDSGRVSLRVSRGRENGEQKTENTQEIPHSQFPIPHCLLHFEIEDTGSGITPEELETIFEAFVQTPAGQQFQEGTGLGLTITRKFVQLMGGEISIQSQVGKGTVISFDIQAHTVAATDIPSQPPTRRVIALEPNQPRYRILIVDDRTNNRQVLSELLSPFGFELKEASNGLEALAIWEAWEPHLIMMDMRMPVMDGYEATTQIRTQEKERGEDEENSQPKMATPIIAITASSLEEERTFVLSVGCDDFIRKPFPEAEIFNALHKHLGVRFIYDELTAAPPTSQTQSEISIPTVLATLPSDLLANFRQALLELDVERVQASVVQIRLLNPPLADAIAPFANKFQYEQLLDFIAVDRQK